MSDSARLVDELTTLLYEVTTGWDDSAGGHQVVRCGACRRRADRAESVVHDSDCPVYRLIRANAEEIADLEDVRDGLEAQVNAMTAENERGQQAFADLTLALVERINALEAERDEWKRINQSDNQCAARRLEQAESERDALAARFDEQVRRAGEGRGMSDYAVCAECGVFTNCDEIDAAYLPERDEWTCGPCVRKGDES